ncbi:Hint domain-containing protein [Aliiroseovarius subalbicans]|uniref:Hint domain-containing protein n=1 Tax=Aliiroseovarius subalbicans TaxID=2925840 RepID=UPI001F5A24C6|nr:Hint domain-containing protein [Aliiroseovarius subalbicans]MCI2399611.1 Hint domain-containing protein [Aliiroseovarius subalbicans]
MAILDNAIWLTGAGGTAVSGTTVITDGAFSTTVTGTFTANAWDDDQSGYAVSEFGAFGVSSPITADYQFSQPVENLSFDLQHVNSSGSTYDDMFTIYAYDENGIILDAADVIAGLSGLVDETVVTNPDGSVSIEADGGTANDVTLSLPGQISQLSIVLENGPDGTQSGGTGIGDLSFDVPAPDSDGDGVADDVDVDIDGDGILNEDEYGTTTPSTITVTFDGDQWSGSENTWELYDASGTLIASGNPGDSTIEITDTVVPNLGEYTLQVYDTYGDGISGGEFGEVTVAVDGIEVYNSGGNPNFGTLLTGTFTVAETMSPVDSDGDGIFDHLDLDSDNDGITDNIEAQSTDGYVAPTGVDSDGDGLDDAYETGGLTPVDSDGDGTADYIDTDSDNDGTDDVAEAGHGVDQATIDASGDSDGDGIMDAVDDVFGWDVNDTDIDALGDFLLTDTDGDTATDGSGATPLVNDLDFRDNLTADYIVEGGAGNDVIDGSYTGDPDGDHIDSNDHSDGSNDDTILADGGDDTIWAGLGDDTVSGGAGDDTIYGGAGNDVLDGDGGDDIFALLDGFGSDTITGGETGEIDGDLLDLSGLTVDTTIDLANSNSETGSVSGGGWTAVFSQIEKITLGSGRDTLTLADGSGDDVVSGFDLTDSGDGTTNDQLDVSSLTDANGDPVNAWDVVVTDDGFGNALLSFPNGESILLEGVAAAAVTGTTALNSIGVPCFTPGTLIRTPCGEVPIETLKPGDTVMTADNGAQELMWIGTRTLTAKELFAQPNLKPVLIPEGVCGNYAPLLVSPLHGMMLDAGQTGEEALARAKHLAEAPGPVRIAKGKKTVTYIHLMFAEHQIVFANGAASESFYPGKWALEMFPVEIVKGLQTLVPGLGVKPVEEAYGPTARKFLKRKTVLNNVVLRSKPLAINQAA